MIFRNSSFYRSLLNFQRAPKSVPSSFFRPRPERSSFNRHTIHFSSKRESVLVSRKSTRKSERRCFFGGMRGLSPRAFYGFSPLFYIVLLFLFGVYFYPPPLDNRNEWSLQWGFHFHSSLSLSPLIMNIHCGGKIGNWIRAGLTLNSFPLLLRNYGMEVILVVKQR